MQRECKVRIKLAQKIENAVTHITSSTEWEGGGGDACKAKKKKRRIKKSFFSLKLLMY